MRDLFSGAVKFCPAWMNSLSEYSYKEILPGELSWYGYPGSAGCTPLISSTRVAGITYYSTQKDKAWEVIKYMLSEDIQYTISFENNMDGPYTDLYTSDIIPVNVAAFRKLNKEAMGGDVVLGVPQAEMDRFKISTVRMDKLLDEEATENKKSTLTSSARSDHYREVVDGWKEGYTFTLDEKLWEKQSLQEVAFTQKASN
jgi:ABC-type thiamine transport system substrate-binding protein